MSPENIIEIVSICVVGLGSLGVTWLWSTLNFKNEQYKYLDNLYLEILNDYFANPTYSSPAYIANIPAIDQQKYNCFAMKVHAFLESIYDIYKGKINAVWLPLFIHHGLLHREWLNNNPSLHEPGYVAYLNSVLASHRGGTPQ